MSVSVQSLEDSVARVEVLLLSLKRSERMASVSLLAQEETGSILEHVKREIEFFVAEAKKKTEEIEKENESVSCEKTSQERKHQHNSSQSVSFCGLGGRLCRLDYDDS